MEFKTSPDLPFVLRGGVDPQTALYNRIAALNRLNLLVQQYIPDFDIRQKSVTYTMCLDLEMKKRFYPENKDVPISEDFIQKMAGVCLEMEREPEPKLDEREFDLVKTHHFSGYMTETPKEKKGFIQKIVEKLNAWK